MVKHCIIWKLKSDLEDKKQRAEKIKSALEGLTGKIDGLMEMRILTQNLSSSSGDIMMDSVFISQDALNNYQKNPLHLEIANNLVRPSVCERLSFDYEC